ncbi:BTAD domain-containing putative transcriptional regulator [Streptomyces sp. NPDC059002]|uniref:AfsR/SARP family transcriptional regulator n=1 Tax=Streptomyces sp. NPDC059002 TaxID=3346690 RepID=UPI0036970E01
MEVRARSESIAVGGPRQRAVLAALLLSPDQVVSVDSLIEQVWSGSPPSTGRTQVAICVAALRKVFRAAGCEQTVIATVTPGYVFRSDSHTLDTVTFARLVRAGEEQARRGRLADAADLMRDALALWRGPALSDVTSNFAEVEVMRLDEERMHAIERQMALRLELGEHDALLGELTALVQARPLRDRMRAYLMLAQYRSGRRAEALETFREGSQISVEELGIGLSTELQELHQLILQDEALDLAAPAPATTAPAPDDTWSTPAQLPPGIHGFVGRATELASLDQALLGRTEHAPLPVGCITGSPGIGKTGLALNWAHRAAPHFPDGQLFIDLQENGLPLHPREVLHRFLRALGTPADRIPVGVEECAALYRSKLDGRRVLITLDNAVSFAQVRLLLPGSGLCGVLVTGRDGLNDLLESSDTLRVRLGALSPDESVTMLRSITRNSLKTTDPETLRTLAALCDHIPLALRAAGIRLQSRQHWSADDLVARLQDPEQRLAELSHGENSLRNRFDRCFQNLSTRVAAAYHRLGSIDTPEFDLSTGAKTLSTTSAEAEDLIERLVDAHLLEVVGRDAWGGFRYRWKELLRFHARAAG